MIILLGVGLDGYRRTAAAKATGLRRVRATRDADAAPPTDSSPPTPVTSTHPS